LYKKFMGGSIQLNAPDVAEINHREDLNSEVEPLATTISIN